MSEHYFSENQTTKFNIKTINETINNKEYTFFTAPGVFSAKKIDKGTRLLVEAMQIKPNDRVLDLGCGIGVIGKIAAEQTKNEVMLTDINQRACKLAKMNTNDLLNTKIIHSNAFEYLDGELFDVILLNPPQTAGKKICFDMIENSKKHLNKEGTLQLVARHNKGGETLSEKMRETFGNMETTAKQGGYRVYLSRLK